LVGCNAIFILKALVYVYSIRKNAICSWGFKLTQEQL
jgi:hypothetical protein